MIRLFSAAIGVFLLAVWLVGLRMGDVVWMTWVLGVAGVFALGVYLVDREEVSRVTRAQTLVIFAVALFGVCFLGWALGAAQRMWLSGGLAASVALVVGLFVLVSTERHGTDGSHGRWITR